MESAIALLMVILTCRGRCVSAGKATVQTQSAGAFHPGGQIVFTLKLNEPLPKGAHFDLRTRPYPTMRKSALVQANP